MSFSNTTSRLFGIIADFKFYKPLQNYINKKYIQHFNINMNEFDDYKNYNSLNELFTRKLLIQRNLDDGFISPSDGKILKISKTFKADDENFAFSIKGFAYSVDELLKDNYKQEELKNGFDYVNIYLSPKDYHRYHSPCDIQILSMSYINGLLYSVNEKTLKKIANVYTKNERVSLKCKKDNTIFWLVFVGAQNVGKMNFVFDKNFKTNAKNYNCFYKEFDDLYFKKGEELGNFELGSTIVIISEKDKIKFKIKDNENIKFGQKIGDFI